MSNKTIEFVDGYRNVADLNDQYSVAFEKFKDEFLEGVRTDLLGKTVDFACFDDAAGINTVNQFSEVCETVELTPTFGFVINGRDVIGGTVAVA